MSKHSNLHEGEDALEELVAEDFTVDKFSEWHFRINHRLDVWPSTKKFYDRKTKVSGKYGKLKAFTKNFFQI